MPGATPLLETIRSSCQRVATAHQGHVQIDQAAVQQVAAALDPIEVAVVAKGRNNMPVRFEDMQAEINFLALYYLCDFGSGYDPLLKARGLKDAHDMSQFGVLGMHLNYTRLDAAWMAAFSNSTAQGVFGVQTYEDSEVPNLPGVTMSRPGPLAPHINSLAKVVQEAGSSLQEEGASSFGQAIISVVDSLHKRSHPQPAAALLQEIVDTIPGFEDQGLYEGARVVFARKALALVFSLYTRFSKQDPRFDFADIAQLAGDSGAIVAAVLRAKGVLTYSQELAAIVDGGQELPPGAHERGIRAAAVVALDALAAAAGNGVTAAQLGGYLSYLTEEGQPLHGMVTPHITRSTVAY